MTAAGAAAAAFGAGGAVMQVGEPYTVNGVHMKDTSGLFWLYLLPRTQADRSKNGEYPVLCGVPVATPQCRDYDVNVVCCKSCLKHFSSFSNGGRLMAHPINRHAKACKTAAVVNSGGVQLVLGTGDIKAAVSRFVTVNEGSSSIASNENWRQVCEDVLVYVGGMTRVQARIESQKCTVSHQTVQRNVHSTAERLRSHMRFRFSNSTFADIERCFCVGIDEWQRAGVRMMGITLSYRADDGSRVSCVVDMVALERSRKNADGSTTLLIHDMAFLQGVFDKVLHDYGMCDAVRFVHTDGASVMAFVGRCNAGRCWQLWCIAHSASLCARELYSLPKARKNDDSAAASQIVLGAMLDSDNDDDRDPDFTPEDDNYDEDDYGDDYSDDEVVDDDDSVILPSLAELFPDWAVEFGANAAAAEAAEAADAAQVQQRQDAARTVLHRSIAARAELLAIPPMVKGKDKREEKLRIECQKIAAILYDVLVMHNATRWTSAHKSLVRTLHLRAALVPTLLWLRNEDGVSKLQQQKLDCRIAILNDKELMRGVWALCEALSLVQPLMVGAQSSTMCSGARAYVDILRIQKLGDYQADGDTDIQFAAKRFLAERFINRFVFSKPEYSPYEFAAGMSPSALLALAGEEYRNDGTERSIDDVANAIAATAKRIAEGILTVDRITSFIEALQMEGDGAAQTTSDSLSPPPASSSSSSSAVAGAPLGDDDDDAEVRDAAGGARDLQRSPPRQRRRLTGVFAAVAVAQKAVSRAVAAELAAQADMDEERAKFIEALVKAVRALFIEVTSSTPTDSKEAEEAQRKLMSKYYDPKTLGAFFSSIEGAPRIVRLANVVAFVEGSSASPERLFSVASRVTSRLRFKLSASSVRRVRTDDNRYYHDK